MKIVKETERLSLKVIENTDLQAFERIWGDPEVMNHLGGAASLEKLPEVLAFYASCYKENALSVFSIVEKRSGLVIGAAGFNIEESLAEVELIYHFSKSFWGQGYASEAVRSCLELAKAHPQIHIVNASAAPDNKASIHILERAGFKFVQMRFFEDTQQNERYYELELTAKEA